VNEPTEKVMLEHRPGVYICPSQHELPSTPDAAIADWSASTWALVIDRENRERAARQEAGR
jgi:D-serine deaminase-like pyridoxal phosphate-dependent protein